MRIWIHCLLFLLVGQFSLFAEEQLPDHEVLVIVGAAGESDYGPRVWSPYDWRAIGQPANLGKPEQDPQHHEDQKPRYDPEQHLLE